MTTRKRNSKKAKKPEIVNAAGQIILRNVRISFPNLFTARSFSEGQKAKFGAILILDLDDHADEIEVIEDQIEALIKKAFKGRSPGDDRICLRDGEEKEDRDGFGEDVVFIQASNRTRPKVVDRDRSPLTEEDGVIYPGCRVNAIISLWAQDNKFGKRINATLAGVQFDEDDEPLGSTTHVDDDDFVEYDD